MAEKDNIHAGHRQRIRERYEQQGLAGFAEHEVLELLLTFAIARKDVNPLAHELIAQFGSLAAVLEADKRELMRVNGVGENTAALITLMPQLLGLYRRSAMGEKPVITNISEARHYCQSLFFGEHEEKVYLLCLDQAGRVLHPVLLRKGTVDEVNIYPREVVEMALRYRAHTVLLTHNHPSGSASPSQADLSVTLRIAHVLNAIGISLMDHLILAENEVISMKREYESGNLGGNYQAAIASLDRLRQETGRQEVTLDMLLCAEPEEDVPWGVR